MDFTRRITQLLHEEHVSTIALLERLEALLGRYRKAPPPADSSGLSNLLGDLAISLENEVGRHFDIEQDRLFPLLDSGEQMIVRVLTGEHDAIRPLASQLAAQARAARTEGFDAATWSTFQTLGGELIERQISHIQKEEMALLPILDDELESDQDEAIANEYLMSR